MPRLRDWGIGLAVAFVLTACGSQQQSPFQKAFPDATNRDLTRMRNIFVVYGDLVNADASVIAALKHQDVKAVEAENAKLQTAATTLRTDGQNFDSAKLRDLFVAYGQGGLSLSADFEQVVQAAKANDAATLSTVERNIVTDSQALQSKDQAFVDAVKLVLTPQQLDAVNKSIARVTKQLQQRAG